MSTLEEQETEYYSRLNGGKKMAKKTIVLSLPIDVWYEEETGLIRDYTVPSARQIDRCMPDKVDG